MLTLWRKKPHRPADLTNVAQVRFSVGDYYSPMYDTRELEQAKDRLWPVQPRKTVGIDWREQCQLNLCRDVFAEDSHRHFPDERKDDPTEFFVNNGQYPPLDAWILESMLRHYRPRRMIEIGCGFSTLISSRVNRDDLELSMDLTCVDPYPRPFLGENNLQGVMDVREEKVEHAPLEIFEKLDKNDILFIDTSHTVKTGGDVTWLFHEVLPRLAPGVIVHIHDIFLPHEYPQAWVLEGWGWNEMYLVRAFLLFNATFEILWGTAFMLTYHRDEVLAAFPEFHKYSAMAGASLWLQRAG